MNCNPAWVMCHPVHTLVLAVAVHDGGPVVADLSDEVQGGLGHERLLALGEVLAVDDGQPGVRDVVVLQGPNSIHINNLTTVPEKS